MEKISKDEKSRIQDKVKVRLRLVVQKLRSECQKNCCVILHSIRDMDLI